MHIAVFYRRKNVLTMVWFNRVNLFHLVTYGYSEKYAIGLVLLCFIVVFSIVINDWGGGGNPHCQFPCPWVTLRSHLNSEGIHLFYCDGFTLCHCRKRSCLSIMKIWYITSSCCVSVLIRADANRGEKIQPSGLGMWCWQNQWIFLLGWILQMFSDYLPESAPCDLHHFFVFSSSGNLSWTDDGCWQ